MARIAGVNIPENKHLEIALTHIYGIGKKTAQDICTSVKLDYSKKVSDLSEEQVETIRTAVAEYHSRRRSTKISQHKYKKTYGSWMLQRYQTQKKTSC